MLFLQILVLRIDSHLLHIIAELTNGNTKLILPSQRSYARFILIIIKGL